MDTDGFATEEDAIFEASPDGEDERIVPSPLAQGPWNPKHQHGGPACALLARAVEGCAQPVPMRVARITFDLTRGVPLEPLRSVARVVRGGKRVQLVDASLVHGDVEVARARGLLLRKASDVGVPEAVRGVERMPKVPGRGAATARFDDAQLDALPGFIRAIEFLRPGAGGQGAAGERALAWTALRCPVVRGEQTSPLVRLAALCDFTSGIGNVIDHARFTSINPDVTLHVLREPRGEGRWIGINAETFHGDDGTAQSLADLYDEEGLVARAQTSLLVDRR